RLGGTITRGDGSFVIKGQPNCFAQKVDVRSKILELRKHVHSRYRRFFDFLCKALSASSEQIALRVLDVGGRQLAAKSLRVWGASLNRRVMLAVPSEALREHEARLVKLDGAERSFLPVPEMVESILRAVHACAAHPVGWTSDSRREGDPYIRSQHDASTSRALRLAALYKHPFVCHLRVRELGLRPSGGPRRLR